MKIVPVPFLASVVMSRRCETGTVSWFFNGLTIVASNSRAEALSSTTRTVICGI